MPAARSHDHRHGRDRRIETYPGNPLVQTYYSAGLKAEYNLTRSIVIKGAYTFQRMTSNQAGSDYTANIMMVGLRLQQ